MKRLISGLFAAALLAASPAWADRERDDDWRHDRHAEKHWKKAQKHREKAWRKHERHAWEHHDRHHYAPPRQVVTERYYHYVEPYAPPRRVVTERHYHYVEPVPVYAAPVYAPPAGIHVVLPNIHIPIR